MDQHQHQSPAPQTLRIHHHAGFYTVCLHRPEARNAMNQTLIHELTTFFSDLSRDAGRVRAVIVRGTGPVFCAGADLKDMAHARTNQDTHRAMYSFNRAFGTLLLSVQACPAVVIAAVHGAALGGGFGLMCAADIAVVTADASVGMPETRLGLPPAQIAPFVVQRIGLTRAKTLALLGQRLSGSEAHALGLVDKVAPTPEQLDVMIQTICADITRCAPHANAATKALLHSSASGVSEALLDQAAHTFASAACGPEGQEGNAAFLEKRPPVWSQSLEILNKNNPTTKN
ncbi:MAG: enoyl-CoA hydratase-related protein [Gammaproteobacteria bacterium]